MTGRSRVSVAFATASLGSSSPFKVMSFIWNLRVRSSLHGNNINKSIQLKIWPLFWNSQANWTYFFYLFIIITTRHLTGESPNKVPYIKIHKIPKAQKRKMKISFTTKYTYRIWDDEGKEERRKKKKKVKNLRLANEDLNSLRVILNISNFYRLTFSMVDDGDRLRYWIFVFMK